LAQSIGLPAIDPIAKQKYRSWGASLGRSAPAKLTRSSVLGLDFGVQLSLSIWPDKALR
jgi:hypothetical protein